MIAAMTDAPNEPVKAWAVFAPNGDLIDVSIFEQRMEHVAWNKNMWLEAKGSTHRVRVIPVTISPLPAPQQEGK